MRETLYTPETKRDNAAWEINFEHARAGTGKWA
jgi:hypothetical protein